MPDTGEQLKAQGGYVQQDVPLGTWVTHEPGTLLRCPAPHCGKAFFLLDGKTIGVVRVRAGQPSEVRGVGGSRTCGGQACRAILEVRLFPAT